MSRAAALALDAATYQRHPIHADERIWPETNCYIDLWVEVLHTLGCDPVVGLCFTVASDYDDDQWGFGKYPEADLRALYGIDVAEINAWRPLADHVEEQLARGRLLTVEADAFHLPDTAGVSYRLRHDKTTIGPVDIDRDAGRLGYFHGPGYFEIAGEDYEVVMRTGPDPVGMVPYVELVRLEHLVKGTPSVELVAGILRGHLARRPERNPVTAMGKRIVEDVARLAEEELDFFHGYAFGTCRMFGSTAELCGDLVAWFDAHDGGGLADVAEQLRAVAQTANTLQLKLARAARGRAVDVQPLIDEMADGWDGALDRLAARYGG
ncbi:MAG TPA: DUF1839 family protein [Mycobacteriales bacterium]|nr:DUF1839 family protein [Mycobacteriales bacterium]